MHASIPSILSWFGADVKGLGSRVQGVELRVWGLGLGA